MTKRYVNYTITFNIANSQIYIFKKEQI